MANSAIRRFICVPILFTQLIHLAVPDTIQDYKKEKISKWTARHVLNCTDKNATIWKKNSRTIQIPESEKKKKLASYLFPLLCVNEIHEGRYTCHAKENGPPLRGFEVEVTDREKDKCGRPRDISGLQRKHVGCPRQYTVKKYPCCKNTPVAPEKISLSAINTLSNSRKRCSDFYSDRKLRLTRPHNIIVEWEKDSLGSFGTWGWKVTLVGLYGDANYQECYQIIGENKGRNLTIESLALNAKYNITVQTLPVSSDKPNARAKSIKTSSLLEMCDTPYGRNCRWEFCFPVVNLTVTNHSSYPVVSWRPSRYYQPWTAFEVKYHDEDNTDVNRFIQENITSYNLTKLQHKYGHKYFVQVRPVFVPCTPGGCNYDYKIFGIWSIKLMFYTGTPTNTTDEPKVITGPHPPPIRDNLDLKIIISVCVTTVCLFIVFAWIVHCKCRSQSSAQSESNEELIPQKSADVLLLHDGHCELCKKATHLFANILWETGHIKCSLDLCSPNGTATEGLGWYEKKFNTCGKVVVICTKDSKNTYENGQGSSFYQKGFRLVLKMILGQITNAVDHNSTQIYPVRFDYSSRDDVPQFLRDKQSFSLPSEIHPLLLSLAGLNARPIGGTEELVFNDPGLQRKINQWENAIRTIQRKHNHHRSGSLTSQARSASISTELDEIVSV